MYPGLYEYILMPSVGGSKKGVLKMSTRPMLAAKRSELTTEALNTVVAPSVVEWEFMFEPLANVFSTLSSPP